MKYSNRIGVVGFDNLIKGANKLKGILPVDLVAETVNHINEIDSKINEMAQRGINTIIGGTAVVNSTQKFGMIGILLDSGEEAILDAVREAKNILKVQLQEKEKTEILKSIIDFAYDGIIGIDKEGKITVFNPVAAKIVGISMQQVVGRYINDVIANTGMLRILRTGETELGEFQGIGETSIVTNRVPIIVNGGVIGAVATFQEVERIQKIERQIRKKLFLKGHIAKSTFDDIVGSSKAITQVKNKARSFAKVDSTILLLGDTGTGKELFAQSIHRASDRHDKPFVAVNCAALPENLLESELFGYVEGAFTGARKEGKPGLFELAHTGTIFLDEISEMASKVQARFLRVLQEKEVTRIGDDRVVPVDVRVIAATNCDLLNLVEEGIFREDLYYRLCVLLLKLPTLQQRKEDIPDLVRYFIRKKSKEIGKKVEDISPEALNILMSYRWPGNVRQLANIIERLVVLCEEREIGLDVISEGLEGWSIPEKNSISDFYEDNKKNMGVLQNAEIQLIKKILEETGGNKTLAAERLGISVTTLWRRLRSMNE